MSNGHSPEWETLGVITSAMSVQKNPMAVMVNYKKKTKQLSFQVGLLKQGRINHLRFWTESMLMEVAMLSRHLGIESALRTLGAKEFTSETLKESVDKNPHLRWVEEYIPVKNKQKMMKMTLGERARRA